MGEERLFFLHFEREVLQKVMSSRAVKRRLKNIAFRMGGVAVLSSHFRAIRCFFNLNLVFNLAAKILATAVIILTSCTFNLGTAIF